MSIWLEREDERAIWSSVADRFGDLDGVRLEKITIVSSTSEYPTPRLQIIITKWMDSLPERPRDSQVVVGE